MPSTHFYKKPKEVGSSSLEARTCSHSRGTHIFILFWHINPIIQTNHCNINVVFFSFQTGFEEFVKLFHYNPEVLSTFPILVHLMNDIEMSSEDYFVGPKTHNRICTHTKSIFEMFDLIIHEVRLKRDFFRTVVSKIFIFHILITVHRYF